MREWLVRSGGDLGRAVAELRQRRGLTQDELAERAGLTRTYLSKIESGRSVSLLEHQLRLLRRLGADIVVSIDDVDDQT